MDDGEMSRADQGPHEGRVQEQSPRVRRARPQGHAVRGWTRRSRPASRRSRPTATRPATRRSWSPRATARSTSSPTSPTIPLFVRHPDWQRILRPGRQAGGRDAPQGLRHAGGRQDAGAGLPLSVPGARPCREGRPAIARFRCRGTDDLSATDRRRPPCGRPSFSTSAHCDRSARTEDDMTEIDPPRRALRPRPRRRWHRMGATAPAGAAAPAGRQAGARLVPLQGRQPSKSRW